MDHEGISGAKAVYRVLVKFDANTNEIIDTVVKLDEELVIIWWESKSRTRCGGGRAKPWGIVVPLEVVNGESCAVW